MTEAERFLEEKMRRSAAPPAPVHPQGGCERRGSEPAVVARIGESDGARAEVAVAEASGAASGAGWFTVEGRLNRMGYFLRMLCVFPAALVGSVICDTAPIIGWPLLLAAIGVNALQAVKRFHDLGQTGWLCLLMLVPVVNVFVGLWLLFGPGEKGGNRYGPVPV